MSTMEQKEKKKKKAYTNCEQGPQLLMGSGSPLGDAGMLGSDLLARASLLDMSCQGSNMKLPLHFSRGQATCCTHLSSQL